MYLQSKRERIQSAEVDKTSEDGLVNNKKGSNLTKIGSQHNENHQDNSNLSSNGISRRNFRFPGVFLPNVNTQTLRPKRSPTKALSAVLSRRNLALVPDAKSTMTSERDDACKSKMATGTDITCLQLADTLMAYHRSPYSGFHGKDPLRARNADVKSEMTHKYVRENTFLIETNDERKDERVPTPSYQTFQSERQRLAMSPSSNVSLGKESDVCAGSQPMPRKSILKNVTKTSRPSSEKMFGCSYQLPGATLRMRPHSETRPSTVFYSKAHNLRTSGLLGLRDISKKCEFTDSVTSVPVRLEKQSTFTLNSGSFQSTRKRMVRFNGANEIHEYTPRGQTDRN